MASELIDHSASTPEVMKFGGAPHEPPNTAAIFCADAALEAAVRRILGLGVIAQLANPALQELSANYDPAAKACRLFIDDGQGPMRSLDALIQPSAIITVSRMLATLSGQSLSPAAPFLSCDLASGFRWHSALPPVSDGAQCSIRVHPRLLRPLSDFMDLSQAKLLESAIAERSRAAYPALS